MKNIKSILITLTVLVFINLFTSCYTPSPLYGTWDDNEGNTITFLSTGEFNAKIKNAVDEIIEYKGTWNCLENVIIIKTESGASFKFEWDVRGAILILWWPDTDNNKDLELRLYHISK